MRQTKKMATFSIEEILPLLKHEASPKVRIDILGEIVRVNSKRLTIFKKSQKCHKCGLEANRFNLEKQVEKNKVVDKQNFHLGMYRDNILFTKKNNRTTCTPCCVIEEGE